VARLKPSRCDSRNRGYDPQDQHAKAAPKWRLRDTKIQGPGRRDSYWATALGRTYPDAKRPTTTNEYSIKIGFRRAPPGDKRNKFARFSHGLKPDG